jgi:RpiR family carbohydrate utilization transcriptional regulator
LFAGVGTSAPLTQDAAYRLAAIGIAAEAYSDVHVQHLHARLLREGDVCVAVSHTGSTRETLEVVGAARAAGALAVAITSFARSPLTELVEHVIVAGTCEVSFRLEANGQPSGAPRAPRWAAGVGRLARRGARAGGA